MLDTIILSINRNEGDKIFVVISVFEVVKILTGQKFDVSFFLEVPFSSCEIKAVSASSEKMPFDNYCLLHLTMVDTTQRVFTCSKSTIETLEQGVKYVQS